MVSNSPENLRGISATCGLICIPALTPAHFFSHGSTIMLGECESASYWKMCGDEALEKSIKGVAIIVSMGQRSVSCLAVVGRDNRQLETWRNSTD